MNVLLYGHKQYKTLLGFLSSEDSPSKEIHPIKLTLVSYRAARLGFRKRTVQYFLSETLTRHDWHYLNAHFV